tara:strand:+ start:928 stop:1287 length:360 start_codon:yes stop_codon:yes gene_type:complete
MANKKYKPRTSSHRLGGKARPYKNLRYRRKDRDIGGVPLDDKFTKPKKTRLAGSPLLPLPSIPKNPYEDKGKKKKKTLSAKIGGKVSKRGGGTFDMEIKIPKDMVNQGVMYGYKKGGQV